MSTAPITFIERPEDPFADARRESGIRGEDLALRRAATQNLRRHWARDVVRVSALFGADAATATVVGVVFRRALVLFPGLAATVPAYLSLHIPFIAALVLCLAVAGAYRQGTPRREAARILRAALLAAVLLLYPVLFVAPMAFLEALVILVPLSATGVYASRRLVDLLVGRVRPVVQFRTILVAQSGQRLSGRQTFDAGGERLEIVDTIVLDGTSGSEMRRDIRALANRIAELGADTVLLWGGLTAREFAVAVDVALASGCRLVAGPSPKTRGIEAHPTRLDGVPFAELTRPHLSAWQYGLKRSMDIVGSTVLMLALSPLLAVITVAIKRDSPGPVLFGHRRLGARGRVFRCYKFRSMRCDAEQVLKGDADLYALYVANHYKLPEERDPRITRVGRFLRRTSLDELPQLLNVLKGDMSLVGPRPIVPEELDHYAEDNGLLFLSLRPGMTGAWASQGRSQLGYPGRAQMELDYVRQWSVWGDLAILLRTIPAVLRGRGAH